MRLDVGGGENPRPGYVNLDLRPGPGVTVCDIGRDTWPFPDATFDHVYSSHCLEHVGPLESLRHCLHELVRVAKLQAPVEVRVPHWLSPMAMCPDHRHVLGQEEQWDHITRSAVPFWWKDSPRRLTLVRLRHVPSGHFNDLRRLYPLWRDEDILRFAPAACHELVVLLEVVANV